VSAMTKRLVLATMVVVLVFGIATLMMPTDAFAKGKPHKPPKCKWCPQTIEIGDVVCTLDACGFDCVYSCPLPFP